MIENAPAVLADATFPHGEHRQHHHHVCHAVAPPLCQRSSRFELSSSSSSSSSSSLPTSTLPNLVVVDQFPNHRLPNHLDFPLTNIVATTSVFAASESSLPVLETSDNEQTSYTLDSATPLEPRSSACHRPRSSVAWFSLVRRRCSNICDWLPRMCSCLDTDSTQFLGSSPSARNYQRLSPKGSGNLFANNRPAGRLKRLPRRVEENQPSDQQTEKLRFYCDDDDDGGGNDDHASLDLTVENDLRAVDLCELLKAKRHALGVDWSIVETWPELGIERALEDHEDVLAVHRETRAFTSSRARKFVFRRDYLKYEFFHDTERFFSTEMIDVPAVIADDCQTALAQAEAAIRRYLEDERATDYPEIFGVAWIRNNGRLNVWRRIHLLLRDRKLYQTKKKSRQACPLVHLSDYTVYKIANARKRYRAPFPWGICLRPSSGQVADAIVAESNITTVHAGEAGLKVIAFHSEKSRACWLTAMRLAKYGKQLRENYRAFKNKQCEQTDGPKDRYVNYNVSNESVRSRVAMDFTGSVGRIVDDPKEAKNIAENEGVNWRRTWRPFSRPPPSCAVVRLHGLDDGIHVLQPWFHRGLKRDIAAAIVRDQGSVDGVFLVRESKSNLGAYVLTYKYSEKVFHAQIQPVFDERCNCWLYTLDKGVTRFYDLLQLIEFYQLNAGCLPTRLTHYVQNGVPEMLPMPVPVALSQSDDGSPPSPTELDQPRFVAGGDGELSNNAASSNTGLVGHKSI
ncbi:growth factor receptor-bound protein 14-like isoform X2 [Frieseomelitta varia]|uniref:growth factor receptor-bound protein 14-like isoform X2 n=1 Tax=Frieseomelitta varia TaxID=561572 RepID=UPI001CB67D7F|nr:growth factor receptor-bound protein 14-like isoform X2 [Frieseomelitta varia]